MNAHGHLHNQFEPTAWHINLAVEGTGYSPVGLVWVLDNARQRHACSASMQQAIILEVVVGDDGRLTDVRALALGAADWRKPR